MHMLSISLGLSVNSLIHPWKNSVGGSNLLSFAYPYSCSIRSNWVRIPITVKSLR